MHRIPKFGLLSFQKNIFYKACKNLEATDDTERHRESQRDTESHEGPHIVTERTKMSHRELKCYTEN